MGVAIDIKSLGIDRLSVEDRLALIEEIWESLSGSESAIALTDAQREELDRRLADHRANPADVVSWEELEKSLDAIRPS
jgi:putative addiction module component (TIGR02574 family)